LTVAAGIAMAMGGSGSVPDWDAVKAEFDAELAAPLDDQPVLAAAEPQDGSVKGIQLRALGLQGG
jgi:hypothetical protein